MLSYLKNVFVIFFLPKPAQLSLLIVTLAENWVHYVSSQKEIRHYSSISFTILFDDIIIDPNCRKTAEECNRKKHKRQIRLVTVIVLNMKRPTGKHCSQNII
jgi:hypothetical protein